jgi:hypothetical protein
MLDGLPPFSGTALGSYRWRPQKNAIDALVTCNLRVELSQRNRVGIVLVRIGNSAASEHVVEDDQAALPNQPHDCERELSLTCRSQAQF